MKVFSGFPAGKTHLTPLPDAFFTDLLPSIDDLGELKVTLHVIWLLDQKRGALRFVDEGELLNDAVLLSGFAPAEPRAAQQLIREGLQRAVERGALLPLKRADAPDATAYFLNSEKGRQAWEQAQRSGQPLRATPEASAPLKRAGNNIFVLYEQNIGVLTPLIADQLRDMEKTYAPEWIVDAVEIAVSRNKRHLRYIQNILRRWETEGRDGDQYEESGGHSTDSRRKNYKPDEYSDIIVG